MTALRMSQVIVSQAFTTLPPEADKRTVIALLVQALVAAKRIKQADVQPIVEETLKRESVGSTGIGHGIGIPHCRTGVAGEIICSFGHCPDGLDFDSLDGEPVYSVFMLLTPPELKESHLQLMRNFASQIRKEHFCEFLHQVGDARSLIELLAEFEAR